MLQAQVNYWNLVETRRHNVATEQQAMNELAELFRHNSRTETLGFFNYAETAKHNRATESQAQKELKLGYANLSEQRRTHLANESIGYENANTNRLNAQINAQKVYYDNINTQYANRTGRMNAYNNQANTIVREMELLQTKRKNDIEERKIPAQYMPKISISGSDLIGGKK